MYLLLLLSTAELVEFQVVQPSDMEPDENIWQPLEYFKVATPTYTEH